jgi:iron complex transport system substrate-binding protein
VTPRRPTRVVALLAALGLLAGACGDAGSGAGGPEPTVAGASLAGRDAPDDPDDETSGDDASGGTATTSDAADEVPVVPLATTSAATLPVTVTDASGVEVTVTDTSRIVPLVGSVAEIVFSLGLGDQVVGRDVAATFALAEDLPVVTQGHEIDVESVLSLRPTVVLADTWVGPPEAIDQLRATGVPVVLVDEAWTLDDVAPRIEAIATALGVPDDGEALIARTDAEIERAATAARLDTEVSVAFLYLRGTAGVYLLGGPGSGADALIQALGAVDAGTAIGLERAYTPLTSEALIDAAPDVLLVMDGGLRSVGGVEGLLEMPGIAQTPAARDGRVVAADDDLLLSFGPRTGAVLELLADDLRAVLSEPGAAVGG